MGERTCGFAVFHAVDPWAMVEPQRDYEYYLVADVTVTTLNEAFEVTNHGISGDWTKGDEVVWYPSGVDLRSTSVGDVIYSYQEKASYLVLPIGFTRWFGAIQACVVCGCAFFGTGVTPGCYCCVACANEAHEKRAHDGV